MNKRFKPYGVWPSPLSARMLGQKKRLNDVQITPDGRTLVWSESRSDQTVLVMQRDDEAPRDLFADLSLRPGVGYGGGDFALGADFVVFTANGRLYRQPLTVGLPAPLTPAYGGAAAPAISADGQWVAYVHTYEDRDVLAVVHSSGQYWPVQAAQGADFYMQPVWGPREPLLAWVEWDFPNMPWDGTRLMLGRWHDGRLHEVRQLAGSADVPIFQPAFSPDGRWLAYIAQDGEWDTLYLYDLASGETRPLVRGGVLMTPAWIQGLRTFAWRDAHTLVFIENDRGFARLQEVNLSDGQIRPLNAAPYAWLSQPAAAGDGTLALIASSSRIPDRVIRWTGESWRVAARSESESLPPAALPEPRPIQWQAEDGVAVHGLYYPPTSADWQGEGLPPAILSIHGGPTSQRTAAYNPNAAYFTSRGYAWLEVNYRGSTGYGRSYMQALYGRWGELDVRDAVGAAQALAAQKLADPKRLVIYGGSAGGYTVYNALIQHPGVFKAGVAFYGVSDLFSLGLDTHKFERHYDAKLVGELPQAADKFRAWSPIFHVDKIRDPLAVFQGGKDKVVVPDQSERIVAALRANRVPHIYHVYPEEGHGWRKRETLEDFYPRVERFLLRHVLFA